MTGGFTRGLGALILILCSWWTLGALSDMTSVSPIHWGLLLPHLALVGFPALVGAFTAAALMFGRPGARALGFAFAVAVAQAAAISYLVPEFQQRYSETVELGKESVRESAPSDGH
jgi:hypothetical protein